MGTSSSTTKNTYEQEQDDHRRVAPMGRTPKKPRTIEDDIFVVKAGTAKANGRYKKVYLTSKSAKAKQGNKGGHLAERNGAGVYRNFHGFQISREIIDDEAGWILGKRDTQEAFYGINDASFLPPPKRWGSTWQFVGAAPCPTISLHFKDAVAIGYNEMEEEQAIQAALFEEEQHKLGKKKHKNIKIGTVMTKINLTAPPTPTTSGSHEPTKKVSKWTIVKSNMENKNDHQFLPISPSRQRASNRRQRPPTLAWKTPEQGTRKKLNKLPTPLPSPVFKKAVEMSSNTTEERTESYKAKRAERYEYYQNRLANNNNNNNNKQSENRSPLSNLKNKRKPTIEFVWAVTVSASVHQCPV